MAGDDKFYLQKNHNDNIVQQWFYTFGLNKRSDKKAVKYLQVGLLKKTFLLLPIHLVFVSTFFECLTFFILCWKLVKKVLIRS